MSKTKKYTPTHYRCFHAATQFYTKDKVYELTTNEDEHKVFTADDGLFDLKSMVISKFKALTEEEVTKL